MKKLKHYIFSALIFTLAISQTFEYLQQKKLMEDYYKEQIFDEISTTLLSKNQFTVKVKIDLNGIKNPIGTTNSTQSKSTVKSQQKLNSGLDFITGVKRDGSVSPTGQKPQIDLRKKQSAEGSISNMDVIVYVDESQSTGTVKDNIETLVRNIIPESFSDCDDCIQIKSMPFQRQNINPESSGGIIEQLKQEIEELKEAESQRKEKNMQDSLSVLTSQLKILEQMARNQFIKDSLENAFKLREAETIVKARERTEDSLLVFQAKKIDELRKEHTTTLAETKDQLIDVLKGGTAGEDSGVLGTGMSNSTLIIVIGSIIILLLFIAIISSRKSKVQTVYLKPKNNNGEQEKKSSAKKKDKEKSNKEETEEQPKKAESAPVQQTKQAQINPFLETQIHQDPNVIQSEVHDLKQSAVSLTVGQKEGATSVIKDWLEDAPKDEEENSENDNNEE